MRKVILIIVPFTFIILPGFSQQSTDSIQFAKNTVLIEILGSSGSSISLQYDRIVKQNTKSYFNLNGGFGYFPPPEKSANPNYGISLSINRTNGIKKRHLELGIGLTYSKGFIQVRDRQNVTKNTFESLEAIYSTIRIGYKYQKPTGGLFFRVGFTPMIKLYRLSKSEITGENFLPMVGYRVRIYFGSKIFIECEGNVR